MWQKVELTSEETVKENESAIAANALARLGGIQAVMAEVEALPETPKKERKRKDNIISRLNDPVNSPSHYTTGGIETIDFIEAKELDYNLGNVVKYITRADKKGRKLEDLKKAQWYLNRAVSNLEKL
jgi:hypothetical protein